MNIFANSAGEQHSQTLSFLIQEQLSKNCPEGVMTTGFEAGLPVIDSDLK